jgi:hypothetical protein
VTGPDPEPDAPGPVPETIPEPVPVPPAEAARQLAALLVGAAHRAADLASDLASGPHTPVEGPLQAALNQTTAPLPPPSEHRRAHRSGRPARLETDAELQAFVAARIDRMTFDDLAEAEAVAAAFPPERSVAKSALAAWSLRRRRARPAR